MPEAGLEVQIAPPHGAREGGVRRPGLGVGDAVVLGTGFYAVLVVAYLVVRPLETVGGLSLPRDSWLVAGQLVAWPATILLGLRLAGARAAAALPARAVPTRLAALLFVAALCAQILLAEVEGAIPMPEAVRRELMQAMAAPWWMIFLTRMLLAPVAEEAFFRGVLLDGFVRRFGPARAIVGTAVVFAVFHLNPWQAVGAFPIGLACAWLVLRTGSLGPAILVHATANAAQPLLWGATALLAPRSRLLAAEEIPATALVLAAAVGAAAACVAWRMLRPGAGAAAPEGTGATPRATSP